MQVRRVGVDQQHRSRRGTNTGRATNREGDTSAAQVQQLFVTERLGEFHRRRKTFGCGLGARDHPQMLRPHSEDDRAGRRQLSGHDRDGQRDRDRLGSIHTHREPVAVSNHLPRQQVHRRAAKKTGDERIRRRLVHACRRVHLAYTTLVHDHDTVAQGHRLDLVVGHVEHRGAKSRVQAREFATHLATQRRIEIRERLVEQEHARLSHDRAPDGHALPLPARELAWATLEQIGQTKRRRGCIDTAGDLALRSLAKA